MYITCQASPCDPNRGVYILTNGPRQELRRETDNEIYRKIGKETQIRHTEK